MSNTGMLQRCWEHDYCAPSFYMITVVTEPRRECLSVLLDPEAGAASGTEQAAPACPVPAAAPAAGLWQHGFQDSILLRRGQLKAMANYIADNPRRLAAKRANPALFTVVAREVILPGKPCAAIGNRFLLQHPLKRRIQVSRRVSPPELALLQEELLYAALHGAVLVSPCISPGEKGIARAALNAGHPLIVLLANGFAPHYKPPGRYFDACAAGRLLILAPLAADRWHPNQNYPLRN